MNMAIRFRCSKYASLHHTLVDILTFGASWPRLNLVVVSKLAIITNVLRSERNSLMRQLQIAKRIAILLDQCHEVTLVNALYLGISN